MKVLAERIDSGFRQTFLGGCFVAFVEYFCNQSHKMRAKSLKNYISVLVIVYYRNWLDASIPLIAMYVE